MKQTSKDLQRRHTAIEKRYKKLVSGKKMVRVNIEYEWDWDNGGEHGDTCLDADSRGFYDRISKIEEKLDNAYRTKCAKFIADVEQFQGDVEFGTSGNA